MWTRVWVESGMALCTGGISDGEPNNRAYSESTSPALPPSSLSVPRVPLWPLCCSAPSDAGVSGEVGVRCAALRPPAGCAAQGRRSERLPWTLFVIGGPPDQHTQHRRCRTTTTADNGTPHADATSRALHAELRRRFLQIRGTRAVGIAGTDVCARHPCAIRSTTHCTKVMTVFDGFEKTS